MRYFIIAHGPFVVQVDSEGHVYLCYTGLPVTFYPFIAEGI